MRIARAKARLKNGIGTKGRETMHRRRLLIGAAILASVLAVGAVACDDDEDDNGNGAVATPTIEIPSDGDDLATPTTAADETPTDGDDETPTE
jgi:hypothetical protein